MRSVFKFLTICLGAICIVITIISLTSSITAPTDVSGWVMWVLMIISGVWLLGLHFEISHLEEKIKKLEEKIEKKDE